MLVVTLSHQFEDMGSVLTGHIKQWGGGREVAQRIRLIVPCRQPNQFKF